ncbi:penicillin-binding transpeptidase domain-containing protein, partial [Klebsiella pneumoniae]|uniref:penicillin-binding transpeptidase domain-containing protein n=1 Tax=Klebsiella pneumoniae TaxID=573 RepID=UPI00210B5973
PERGTQVIDPITAYQVASMLEGVVQRGTAASARGLGRWVGGKTGTTNDSIDTWFAGFHPTLTAVVWMGYDNPRSLGDRETGGGLSPPVWISFMETALKGQPVMEPT